MAIHPELVDRLAFSGLTEERRALLANFLPTLERALPGLLDGFYRHLRTVPDLVAFFDGDAGIERAAAAQGRHWVRLFSARFDEDYLRSVQAIGLTHSRIGLDPRWYVGGYTFMLGQLVALVMRERGSRIMGVPMSRMMDLASAISAAVMIDMELALTGYIAQNKASYDVRLAELATGFEAKIGAMVEAFAVASNELEATAESMHASTGQANERAMTVAAAAEQASAGVQTVASAAEQLSAAIQTISGQVRQADAAAGEAVNETERAQTIIARLNEDADRIGTVIGAIGQIAAKTNMLALNASIEAARAGEAGKSFEVVAAEVKALAAQVEQMTLAVDEQVRAIQSASARAGDALAAISGTVARMSDSSSVIATAIDQQNSATHDISRNIQQTAQAAGEVSTNIVRVSQVTEANGVAAGQLTSSAGTLAEQADRLSAEVSDFISNIRAA